MVSPKIINRRTRKSLPKGEGHRITARRHLRNNIHFKKPEVTVAVLRKGSSDTRSSSRKAKAFYENLKRRAEEESMKNGLTWNQLENELKRLGIGEYM
jgi:hypothetical protein